MSDDPTDPPAPTEPGLAAVLDQLASQADALRRAGREDAADLLLAFRRLHALRFGAAPGDGEGSGG